MTLEELQLPVKASWYSRLHKDYHAYTFTENATNPDLIDAEWHPTDSDEDKRVAKSVGTRFSGFHTKEQLVDLINREIIRII